MADYVLVHGGNMPTDAWNKLVKKEEYPPGGYMGGKIWDKAILELKSKNHRAFAPTLLDAEKNNLSDHVKQICNLIKENRLKDVILVGSSYGGMIITGVADKMPDKIGLLVYLDAALPDPGQSLFDLLIAANYDPKPSFEAFPKAYIEKIYFDPQKIDALPKIYIQCTESSFVSMTNIDKQKVFKGKNWQFFELPTSHIPQATMPEKLIELLLNFGMNF
ncbi:MAG: alpha/beta hydrolase [Parachlamydiales bacterium]|nr:alpha/beta hydrolase [Parachlamydiales bacterium]